MPIVSRRMDGPQDHHEQRAGIAYLDTRTLGAQIRDIATGPGSAFGILALAGLTLAVPALTPFTLPIAGAFTAYVLTRPLVLPLRLPANARLKDRNNPVAHPRRQGVEIPGPATGDWFLGWDDNTGQQLWLSNDDMAMHTILPGSTGWGKSQTIYSLLCNALAQGSGCMIVDGKGSNNLVFSVKMMARRWGREADVRVINMLVSSGDRKSHTWGAFSGVNPEGLSELLRTIFLPEDKSGGGGSASYFRDRADSLIGAMSYVWVWMRDHAGIPITSESIRASLSTIQALIDLVGTRSDPSEKRVFSYYDLASQRLMTMPLPEAFPLSLLDPVRDYVNETGGFSSGKGGVDSQDKVREQHSYVVGGFARAFTQMGSTLGHIFRCGLPGVDFHDIFYNRRILVVVLPSLENHPETNASLGRMTITAQRYALAPALGTSLEGDYVDLVVNRPSSAPTVYPIVYDELGMFVTRGLDVMMAQARELNVGITISFQEVGTMYAALGKDRVVPLLGNPKLKIFGQIEDSAPTKEWLESTGGTMQVSVLPGYESSPTLGVYSGVDRADIREVKRISWSDVQSLRNGQAIILFRGKRIYTRLFYAGIKPAGYNRLHPLLTLHTVPAGRDHPIARAIRGGQDIPGRAAHLAPAASLEVIHDRMARIVDTDATVREDIHALFGAELPRADTQPFAALFQSLGAYTSPKTDLPVTMLAPKGNVALYEAMVALEALNCDAQGQTRSRVASVLNTLARTTVRRKGQ